MRFQHHAFTMTASVHTHAIEHAICTAITTLKTQGILAEDWLNNSSITRTKDRAHGDFASNVALLAAKSAGMSPRVIAEKLIAALPLVDSICKTEIAGPGFINFFLDDTARFAIISKVIAQQDTFGESNDNSGIHVQVEFVSANPTSSLHVGHGRGAAYGMSVARLLQATGHTVSREYYVNDAGRQMDILATSTYLRYLQCCGENLVFPVNGYRGDYVKDMAQVIFNQVATKFSHSAHSVFADVPEDAVYDSPSAQGETLLLRGDKELHIDGLIANSQKILGSAAYAFFHKTALDTILADIKDDLAEFGVSFECWFSEATLSANIDTALQRLERNGHLYMQDGNTWFKSTLFGDEKDRVVKRKNGQTTYFAADIAYHLNKFERGFDHVVNIWGSDHHGYIARVKAAITALGFDASKLTVLLVQFVSLWRGGQMVQMSSRSGQFVSLRELRQEVGNDAARFYYVMRKSEQHIDFDLDLAVSQSKDNAVYYIQYAHARICRMLEKYTATHGNINIEHGMTVLSHLTQSVEEELLAKLAAYPEQINRAAAGYEPHLVGTYLKELAALFHAWYNEHKVISDDAVLTLARVMLSIAIKQVLKNGLHLLGISAPEAM